MIRPRSGAWQYRIIIRGECGRLLVSLIENVRVEPSHNGDTCVVALVRDDPEFWGLLEQFRDLALHVVSLQELGHGNGPADAPAGGKEPAHGGGWAAASARAPISLLTAQQEDPRSRPTGPLPRGIRSMHHIGGR